MADRIFLKDPDLLVFFRRPLVLTETAAIGRKRCAYCGCRLASHTSQMDPSSDATWFCCEACNRPCVAVKHDVDNPLPQFGRGYA